MNKKKLQSISILLLLAVMAGCLEDKPVIERTTSEKKGSLLIVDVWIKNKEWGSFVVVTAEAIAKDTGRVADRQEKEVFIEKGETKRVTFQLSIDRSKDYESRVDAKYTQ